MTSWERRIERAADLALRVPAAAELLRFYIAVGQASGPVVQPERLREVVARAGPPLLAEAARNHSEPAESFIAHVLRQAEAIEAAARSQVDTSGITRNTCPFCGERPVAAVLRPEGEGGKRYLLCSLCLTEWEFRRMLCPNCGEENHEKLPVYTTKEFPHIRVEACDSCRHYLKAIDLTLDGHAVPEVDELAAVTLDLWAAENGYTKLAENSFGF
jgi:formate dehydrogenase maturation protein FdhE